MVNILIPISCVRPPLRLLATTAAICDDDRCVTAGRYIRSPLRPSTAPAEPLRFVARKPFPARDSLRGATELLGGKHRVYSSSSLRQCFWLLSLVNPRFQF